MGKKRYIYSIFLPPERRENFDNLKRYIEIWGESATNFEKLLMKSQEDILKALKIDNKVWEQSTIFQMNVNYEAMFKASFSIPISLKYKDL